MHSQAQELAKGRVEMSPEELRAAAERERVRLEEAGEIDRVGDSLGVGAAAAPKLNTLVGKTIEIRWRYWAKDGNKKTQVSSAQQYLSTCARSCAPSCTQLFCVTRATPHPHTQCIGVHLVQR